MATQTKDKITFESLTIEDGLSQSSVFEILQDNRGMMWFGPWDGLNRYDGYNFAIYRYDEQNPHSLSNNEIRALYEDSQGVLWIGTSEGGVKKVLPKHKNFIHYHNVPEDPTSLSGNDVWAIYEDHQV